MVYPVCLKYKQFKILDVEPNDFHYVCASLKSHSTFKLPVNLPIFGNPFKWSLPDYIRKSSMGFYYDKMIDGKPYTVQLSKDFETSGIYYLVRADVGYYPGSDETPIVKQADRELDIEFINRNLSKIYEGIEVGGITIPYAFRKGNYNEILTPIEWHRFKNIGIDKWAVNQLHTIVYVPEAHLLFSIEVIHLITVPKYVLYASSGASDANIPCLIHLI